MAIVLALLVLVIIGGMLWYGNRGNDAGGHDDGSWKKYTGGGSGF